MFAGLNPLLQRDRGLTAAPLQATGRRNPDIPFPSATPLVAEIVRIHLSRENNPLESTLVVTGRAGLAVFGNSVA